MRAGLVIGALGVVFGDIGTSPIYTLQTVFNPADPHPVPVNAANVYGVVSLIFWSVMIIVTVTYVTLVMRADNDGEGGIMALITLLRRLAGTSNRRVTVVLAGLGVFGASLFFGDSMITPAISIMSAVEGLELVEPPLKRWIVPITVVIIVVLFAVQRRGTATVGRLFGPVMILWFAAIAACGVRGIAAHPRILEALSPLHALTFVTEHSRYAFFALAAIVLAVTGAEALYADMGHFSRTAIIRAWLFVVLPALTISYLGQGALVLGDARTVDAPFFLLIPGWALLPMVLLATAATVIASQAVISGAYSVASQAIQLGYLPRLRVAHTSASASGQIYVPFINGMLLVAVLTLVVSFRSSAALAYAYGMAVCGTIAITTLLFFYVAHRRWGTPLWLVIAGAVPLLAVDLAFFAANLTKLLHGAWLPLLIAVGAFTVMMTWKRGSDVVSRARADREGPLADYVATLTDRDSAPVRVPGTAVFLNRGLFTAPLALRANVKHNHVLHEQVIVVSVLTDPVPRVADEDRIVLTDLGQTELGVFHATARFGYAEVPDVPAALRGLDPAALHRPLEAGSTSYFLNKLELAVGPAPTLPRWRKRIYLATSYVAADTSGYLGLPLDRTVIVGARLEV
ncbi:potassium transporter Kup [Mycobacterium sp. PS03-16]|uniref:potassium transporter Kup n=1 Tax=Mycobacterium sp. PS03-16 TaxID=2559611 RepID=UPI001073AA4F|nr:KUP/HAK/KT family potassium transporter [Mycobacterium sp. PS03-16]TFV55019.1 potassium transporter Kup [Mycobacterium sp. PS03-16]